MEALQDRVIRYLWDTTRRCPDQFLCAVLDGARKRTIVRSIVESDSDHWCLIGGDISPDLVEAAPYLVIFEEGAAILETLVTEGWGNSWGIFLTARPPIEGLLEQLRSNMTARLPDGTTVYFRFFDPLVLRTYLPTCTKGELDRFFGPITCCFAEGQDVGQLVEYRQRLMPSPMYRRWSGRNGRTSDLETFLSSSGAQMTIRTIHHPSGLCQVVR